MNLISFEPIFVDCCFIAYGYQMSLIFSFSKKTYSFKIGFRRGCKFFGGKGYPRIRRKLSQYEF